MNKLVELFCDVDDLYQKGVTLVTTVRKNMKAKAISLWDKAMVFCGLCETFC